MTRTRSTTKLPTHNNENADQIKQLIQEIQELRKMVSAKDKIIEDLTANLTKLLQLQVAPEGAARRQGSQDEPPSNNNKMAENVNSSNLVVLHEASSSGGPIVPPQEDGKPAWQTVLGRRRTHYPAAPRLDENSWPVVGSPVRRGGGGGGGWRGGAYQQHGSQQRGQFRDGPRQGGQQQGGPRASKVKWHALPATIEDDDEYNSFRAEMVRIEESGTTKPRTAKCKIERRCCDLLKAPVQHKAHAVARDLGFRRGLARHIKNVGGEVRAPEGESVEIGKVITTELDKTGFPKSVLLHVPTKNESSERLQDSNGLFVKNYRTAFLGLAAYCKDNGVKELAMSNMGTGLDGLPSKWVEEQLYKAFSEQEITLYICHFRPRQRAGRYFGNRVWTRPSGAEGNIPTEDFP